MDRLLLCLLLVGLVGCGENSNSVKNAVKGLTIENLSEEQQAETHDWMKRSDNVANKGFRIVNP